MPDGNEPPSQIPRPEDREAKPTIVTREVGPTPADAPPGADPYPTRMTESPAEGADLWALEGWPSVPGYEIVGILGRGGMGVVYQARDLRLKRLVALKMIRNLSPGPDELLRFRREAETVASLQHPHIIQIYEVGQHNGLPYLSLEYASGGPLSRHLNGTPLPAPLAARLMETTARAVQAAHQRGIIHRDLKPGNLLLQIAEDRGPVEPLSSLSASRHLQAVILKISDFGLAKRLDAGPGQSAASAIVGTPSYMAPEQATGKGPVGPATDVYALGAILYEMLTGRPPFKAATSMETIHQVISEDPVPPRRLQSGVPRDLETICQKCLQKEPARRYPSALALADDLHRFQEGRPIEARPVGSLERAWRWCRRNPVVAALAATLASVLVVVAVASVLVAVEKARMAKQAEETAAESKRRLVRQYVDKGMRLVEAGDAFTALPWLAEALRLDQDDPTAAEAHRVRLAAVMRQCPRLVQVFPHAGGISAVAFRADGRQVAIAGLDGNAQVWDMETGQPVGPRLTQQGALSVVTFSPDGGRLLTASGDWFGSQGQGEAAVWEVATGKRLAGPLLHRADVSAAVFDQAGRRVLTASWDGMAQVWDAASGQPLLEAPLRHAGLAIRSAVFSPDGRHILTAGGDGTARLWDADAGQLGADSILKHSRMPILPPVLDAKFSPDGRWLATAGMDAAARLWDAARRRPHQEPLQHAGLVSTVAFSPDSRSLVTASLDGTARVWKVDTGEPRTPPLSHGGWVTSAAFSPDGRLVLTASWDGTARVWDAFTGQARTPRLKHSAPVRCAVFSPDGRYLLTAGEDGAARLWDLAGGGQGALPLWSRGRVLAVSPDGHRVATGRGTEPRVWDWATGQPLTPRLRQAGNVLEAHFSPDGRFLATVAPRPSFPPRGELRIWDAATGAPVSPPFTQISYVYHLEFSPDGSRLAVSTGLSPGVESGCEVRVWDTRTGQPLGEPLAHPGLVMHVAFAPTGERVVTSGFDGTVQVWDAATGRPAGPAVKHRGPVLAAAFSPDGRRLLTAPAGEVRLLEADSGTDLVAPLEHLGMVTFATFNADGHRVVTLSEDGTARVWETATGQPLTLPMAHAEPLRAAAFSPDGRCLVTLSKQATAQVWDVATGQPLTPPVRQDRLPLREPFLEERGRPPRRFVPPWDLVLRVWGLDLTPAAGPVDDLVRQAEVLASHRLEAPQGLAPLEPAELRDAWGQLAAARSRFPGPTANEVLGWHRQAAEDCERAQLWEGARRHLDRLLELAPGNWADQVARGRALAELGQWEQAAADYDRALADGTVDPQALGYRGLIHLDRGHQDSYRRVCGRLLELYGQTKVPALAEATVRACTRAPNAVPDPTVLVRLLEGAVQDYPNSRPLRSTLGAAQYRAGRFDRAVETFGEAFKAPKPANYRGEPVDWLFRAMAYYRQGQTADAHQCLAKADHLAPLLSGVFERQAFQLLRREAEQLISGAKPGAAPRKD